MGRGLCMAMLLALTLPLLGGCALYASPRLTVTDAQLTDESSDGLVVTFTVAATNPNRVQFPLRSITYSLWLDGRRVFTGSRSPEATLARLSVQELTLPAAVPLGTDSPRPAGVIPYRLTGELTYITPGKLAEVLFDSGVPAPTTSFSEEGTVDFGPVPKAEPPG
jgi:hypothetical protein